MSYLKNWQESVLPDVLQNILALDYYYSRQAAVCTDLICASFLVYVASQKIRQMTILQEMAEAYGTDIFTKSKIKSLEEMDFLENLSGKTLDELFDYVKEQSIRDLKMYSLLSNEAKESELIFSALIDLEEDFMAHIESGYLDHLSMGIAQADREEAIKTLRVEYENKVMQHA